MSFVNPAPGMLCLVRFVVLLPIFLLNTLHALTQLPENEPNNGFETADYINKDDEKSGSVKSATDADDYFKTALPFDGTLIVYVKATNIGTSSSYLAMYGYDKRKANGDAYAYYVSRNSSITAGAVIYDTFTLRGRAADSFYFRFQTSGSYNYTFRYVITDVTPNDVEPNNSFQQAADINLNEIKKGHIGYVKTFTSGVGNPTIDADLIDYYKAVFNTDGIKKVYFKATNVIGDPGFTTGDISITGYDSRKDNGYVFSNPHNFLADGATFSDTITLNCLEADTFYFKIQSQGAFNYEFGYTTTDTASVNDNEPNDGFANAVHVALNNTKKGKIGYSKTGIKDNNDYYSAVLPEKGTVRIIVETTNTSGGSGWLFLNVYDKRKTAGTLLSRYVGNNSKVGPGITIRDTIIINCLNADSLFLNWSSSGCFRYAFKVESVTTAPLANFDYTRTGDLYAFTNTSTNANTYRWDFGNGTISTLQTPPLKIYKPGVYPLKLIANNTSGCSYSDTLAKTITVKGIEKYTPSTGGNGNLLFTVYGGGFKNNSMLRLTKGSKTYLDSSRRVSDLGNIYSSILNMHDAEVGLYDVDIVTEDSTYHFANGFRLDSYLDSLNIELIGRDIVRAKDENVYKVRIYNDGNTIAGITEVFVLFPLDMKVKLLDTLIVPTDYNYSRTNTISEEVRVGKSLGFPVEGNLRGYIIGGIPQGGYKELSFSLNFELGTQPLYAWVRGPFTGSERPFAAECRKAKTKYKLAALNLGIDLVPVVDCEVALLRFRWATADLFREVATEKFGGFGSLISALSYAKTIFNTILQCADEAVASTIVGAPAAPVVFGASELIDIALNIYPIGSALYDMNKYCRAENKKIYRKEIQSRTSLDPNAISGPAGATDKRFVNGKKKTFDYTIFFENLKTATLAAQNVVVYDTLDRNVFDLKSFKAGSFGIGSRSYIVPNNSQEFIGDITIDNNISVRLNIKLDTITGILKSMFSTIDRSTGLATTNPIAGFLPPNQVAPVGEAYISYSIDIKGNLPDGAVILNKASIVFDKNEAIQTNQWVNTIDNIPPSSRVIMARNINDSMALIQATGTDQKSGINYYQLFVSSNGGAFELIGNMSDTAHFFGVKNNTYSFYVLAVDSAGNVESKTASNEATLNFITLPASMLPLNGTKAGFSNLLKWSTVNEQNNRGFIIERSENGILFTPIGFVVSQAVDGNSGYKINYTYTDQSSATQNYYRLKQTDKADHVTYSNIIFMKGGSGFTTNVFPNPANTEMINVISNGIITDIKIIELSGKLVKRLVPSGDNRYNISGIRNGIYILQIRKNGQVEQQKIVVAK